MCILPSLLVALCLLCRLFPSLIPASARCCCFCCFLLRCGPLHAGSTSRVQLDSHHSLLVQSADLRRTRRIHRPSLSPHPSPRSRCFVTLSSHDLNRHLRRAQDTTEFISSIFKMTSVCELSIELSGAATAVSFQFACDELIVCCDCTCEK